MSTTSDLYAAVHEKLTFARIGQRVADAGLGARGPHDAAVVEAEGELEALRAAKVKAPARLVERTAAAVAELRATYEAHVVAAEERLGLPEVARELLRVDAGVEEQRLRVARVWIEAIDATEVV